MRYFDLVFNHNIYRTDQAYFKTCLAQNQTDDISSSRFAICTSYTNHTHFFARIVKKPRCNIAHGIAGIINLYNRQAFRPVLYFVFHKNASSSILIGLFYIFMPINMSSFKTDKQTAFLHFTRVKCDICYNFIQRSHDLSLR